MVRGVIFPYARGGVAAAMILGLGRALGEAIAVALVIGADQRPDPRGTCSTRANTLAAWIATEFSNAAGARALVALLSAL